MEKIRKVLTGFVAAKARAILVVMLAVSAMATIYAAASGFNTVIVDVDGVQTRVPTVRTDAVSVLEQAGIVLNEEDVLDDSGYEPDSDSVIKVYRAFDVTVTDSGAAGVTVVKANGTVADALDKAGIKLLDGDELNVKAEDRLSENMEIRISRAFPVLIKADGKQVKVNLASGTVADALDKAVITIGPDDEISSPLNTPLKAGMAISISRITYKERTVKETVKYKTIKKEDSSLYTGQSKIETKGVNGESNVTYKDKYVNGKLKESVNIKSEVIKAPVDEVLIVGTKERVIGTDGVRLASGIRTISYLTPPDDLILDGNVPTSYSRMLVGTASAYCGGGITSTGRSAMNGYVAVDPSVIPYHTKMWIVSNDGAFVYGYASAEDTGGFVAWSGDRSTICDLYMESYDMACSFGRRSVTIYIL